MALNLLENFHFDAGVAGSGASLPDNEPNLGKVFTFNPDDEQSRADLDMFMNALSPRATDKEGKYTLFESFIVQIPGQETSYMVHRLRLNAPDQYFSRQYTQLAPHIVESSDPKLKTVVFFDIGETAVKDLNQAGVKAVILGAFTDAVGLLFRPNEATSLLIRDMFQGNVFVMMPSGLEQKMADNKNSRVPRRQTYTPNLYADGLASLAEQVGKRQNR